ncbi:hypothetical protein [Candidatus Entotheonella palauensis]|uniref:hypothetical protein n=1 Tax=Candidatus Entotheonella palauensis TaxID=93172 RepID=UPI000B7FD57D|nr:hypothetical protein [Candidatus Entotheonella palauensis]
MASHYAPHGFVARSIFALIDERLIPTPVEELEWLVEKFLLEFSLANSILMTYPNENRVKERKARACWALAVLWKAPPAGSTALVQTWLDQAELRHEVRPYYESLMAVEPPESTTGSGPAATSGS